MTNGTNTNAVLIGHNVNYSLQQIIQDPIQILIGIMP